MEEDNFSRIITDYLIMKPDVKSIIGYGSAVKKQANDDGDEKQIDLILGVENHIAWHRFNHMINPEDYDEKGYQRFKKHPWLFNWGTDVNFLTYLKGGNNCFKLGIIEYDKLIEDLVTWKHGYLAGRMQKAIQIVEADRTLNDAIKKNRENALRVALLLLDEEKHNLNDLYFKLCSLSFLGDTRIIFKMENPNKVDNITSGSFDELHEIYSEVNNDFYVQNGDSIDINRELLLNEVNELPASLYGYIKKHNSYLETLTLDDLQQLQKLIKSYIKKRNLITSTIQPVKGIIINGLQKTKRYAEHKQRKSQQR